MPAARARGGSAPRTRPTRTRTRSRSRRAAARPGYPRADGCRSLIRHITRVASASEPGHDRLRFAAMAEIAVVTGASSGIGATTARALAQDGFEVVVGARRLDRLERLADEVGGRALSLDVADPGSVESFVAEVGECRVLVNNAGGALGLEPVSEADDGRW